MSVFNFFDKKVEGRELSNYYLSPVNIDGRQYASGEHAFHGSKYTLLGNNNAGDGDRKAELLDYGKKFEDGEEFGSLKPSIIKSKGGKKGLRLTDDELRIWSVLSIGVQDKICRYKYNNYEIVRNVLHNTGTQTLVHPALRCSEKQLSNKIWEGKGVVIDGKVHVLGGNKLGKMWMNLRDGTNK